MKEVRFILCYYAKRKDARRHVVMNRKRFSFSSRILVCYFIEQLRNRYRVVVCDTSYRPLVEYSDCGYILYPGCGVFFLHRFPGSCLANGDLPF